MLNKILSFVRVVTFALFIGDSVIADAYFLANSLISNFRNIFIDGSFSSLFTSKFFSLKKENKEISFTKSVFYDFSKILLVLMLVILIAYFIFLVSPIRFNKIIAHHSFLLFFPLLLPLILLMFYIAFFTSFLNCFHLFSITSTAPLIANMCFIGLVFIVKFFPSYTIILLIIGTLSYAAFQLLWMMPFFLKKWNFKEENKYPEIEKITFRKRVMKTAIFQAAIPMSESFVNLILARLPTGTISYFSNSFKFLSFFFEIIGVSFSNVLSPILSKIYHSSDNNSFTKKATEICLAIIVVSIFPALFVFFQSSVFIKIIFKSSLIKNIELFSKIFSILGIFLFFLIIKRIFNSILLVRQITKISNTSNIIYALSNIIFSYIYRFSPILLAWVAVFSITIQTLYIFLHLIKDKTIEIRKEFFLHSFFAFLLTFILVRYVFIFIKEILDHFFFIFLEKFSFFHFLMQYRLFAGIISIGSVFLAITCVFFIYGSIFWKNFKIILFAEK